MPHGITKIVTYRDLGISIVKEEIKKIAQRHDVRFCERTTSKPDGCWTTNGLCRRLKRTKPFKLILESIKHNNVLYEVYKI